MNLIINETTLDSLIAQGSRHLISELFTTAEQVINSRGSVIIKQTYVNRESEVRYIIRNLDSLMEYRDAKVPGILRN